MDVWVVECPSIPGCFSQGANQEMKGWKTSKTPSKLVSKCGQNSGCLSTVETSDHVEVIV